MRLSKFETILFLWFTTYVNKLNKAVTGTQEEINIAIDAFGKELTDNVTPATYSFLMGKYLNKIDTTCLEELKIPTPFNLKVESRVLEAIDKNFPDNKTISQRIWGNTEYTKQLLREELTTAITTGKPAEQVARKFSEITGQSYYNCRRIVRTETVATLNVAALDSYKEAGIKEVEVMENQSGSCDICSPKDGKIVKMENAAIGITIPPFHPSCRGTIKAVIKE